MRKARRDRYGQADEDHSNFDAIFSKRAALRERSHKRGKKKRGKKFARAKCDDFLNAHFDGSKVV